MSGTFVPDNNSFGPFMNEQHYQTGIVAKPGFRFEDRSNGFGGVRSVLVGTWAYAHQLNGVITQMGEWVTTD